MQSTPPKDELIGESSSVSDDGNAFARLANLPPGTDKNTLISTIDSAVDIVLSDLSNHEKGALPADVLTKVRTALNFLEQCLIFQDDEFTAFSKRRANELQTALANTIQRVTEAKVAKKEPEATPEPTAKEPEVQEGDQEPAAESQDAPPAEPEAVEEEEEPFDPNKFLYEREEKILIDFAFKRLSKRLAFMRGDSVVVENGKPIDTSGIQEDGIPPFFLISPQFPKILYPAFSDLVVEKRSLLSRRIYVHTNKEQPDEEVLALYEEEHTRNIDGIVALGFDDWAGEIVRAGIAGLPQETRAIAPKKEEESGGLLKKVFSFGKKDKKDKKKTQSQSLAEDTTPIRVHKEWQSYENQGVFSLSQHFSYSLISYAMQLNEKQFETEYECICQIVNQQETPDVGPVVTNLSRLYKFYDNIFFDLVILVLFQRINMFDVNMLQAACMTQKFVVDRLPLCMDELRRRPMEHAKYILAALKEGNDKTTIKQALTDYFHVHETIHASKVGKRIQASENLLKRQKDKVDEGPKKVIEGILTILNDVNELKVQQEEESTFLGEEILETITEGIDNAVAHL